jgi:hypothetical protein
MPNELSFDELARAWFTAKRAEDQAKANRLLIEERLATVVERKDEGSTTQKTEAWKAAVTFKLKRTMDAAMWDTIAPTIPVNLHPIKVKRELDEKGLKYLQQNEPEIYKKIAPCITVEPAKPSFVITPLIAE